VTPLRGHVARNRRYVVGQFTESQRRKWRPCVRNEVSPQQPVSQISLVSQIVRLVSLVSLGKFARGASRAAFLVSSR